MKKLTIVCGPAGVGKSTYGKKLAAQGAACLLDSDTVTEPVVRAGLVFGGHDPNDRDSLVYKQAFRTSVYECLFQAARENLDHVDVILVGPFTTEIRDPLWLERLPLQFQAQIEVVFLTCDEKVRKERIRQRGNARDEPKLANWEKYLEETDIRPPAFEHRVVRT